MKDKQQRIDVLTEQHHILDSKLDTAIKHLAGNERVNMLKKRKLAIKDEIVRLNKELDNER